MATGVAFARFDEVQEEMTEHVPEGANERDKVRQGRSPQVIYARV